MKEGKKSFIKNKIVRIFRKDRQGTITVRVNQLPDCEVAHCEIWDLRVCESRSEGKQQCSVVVRIHHKPPQERDQVRLFVHSYQNSHDLKAWFLLEFSTVQSAAGKKTQHCASNSRGSQIMLVIISQGKCQRSQLL